MHDHIGPRRIALAAAIAALLGSPPVALPASASDDALRIPTLDEQVADCRRLAGDERDVCLANLVLRTGDPAPCLAVPEGRCAELVAPYAMQRCAEAGGEAERLLCEMNTAAELESPVACREAADHDSCVGAVAAAVEDPDIIAENIADPRARDMHITAYVNATGDESALDLIEDAERSDLARVYSAVTLGAGKDRILPDDYCALRGGYGGEYPEDEMINRSLCREFVALSNWIVMRSRMGDGAGADIERIMNGLAAGEIDLGELFPDASRLPDDFAAWRQGTPEHYGDTKSGPDGSGSFQEHAIFRDRLVSHYVLEPAGYDIRFTVELTTPPPAILVKGNRYPIRIEAKATGLDYPVRSFVGPFGIYCKGPCRIIDKATDKPFRGGQVDLDHPSVTVDAELEATGAPGSSFKIVFGLKRMTVTWPYDSYTPE